MSDEIKFMIGVAIGAPVGLILGNMAAYLVIKKIWPEKHK